MPSLSTSKAIEFKGVASVQRSPCQAPASSESNQIPQLLLERANFPICKAREVCLQVEKDFFWWISCLNSPAWPRERWRGNKQTNKQTEKDNGKRINCQFTLMKNKVFSNRQSKPIGDILGSAFSYCLLSFLPFWGAAVQEVMYFSSFYTCKPRPFSDFALGTAQGKYFHDISSESKEVPVGPCCLCVVPDLLWGGVLAFPQWLRYTDLKGPKFQEPGTLDRTFPLIWEGSQPGLPQIRPGGHFPRPLWEQPLLKGELQY